MPSPSTRRSSWSWKTCTGATRPRSTCSRCSRVGATPSRLLILGTYRPADVAVGEHPLKAAKHELELHGQCEEIPLEFLSEDAVAEYLARRFAQQRVAIGACAALHRRTDGNPLFLVNMIDDLIVRGAAPRSRRAVGPRGAGGGSRAGRARDALADGREADRAADAGRAGDARGRQRGGRGVLGRGRDVGRDRRGGGGAAL